VKLAPPVGAVLIAAVAASNCGGDAGRGDRVDVVATTPIVADLVRNVGGPQVDVRALLHRNADPHGYEPRPSDARAVAEVDTVFRSGGEVDHWLSDVVEHAGGDARTVTLMDSVDRQDDNPHWWHDARNVEAAVRVIRDALEEADPGGRDEYSANAGRYLGRLRRLDAAIAACIERIPPPQRKLVTTHDSFGYFAARYGLEVVGTVIPARSTEAQPSAGETARLVRRIEREGVEAVFPERSLDTRLEEAVAREAGARLGPSLWVDTLGPHGSGGSTYLESMVSNTEAVVRGLTGGRRSCRPRV
jgi:ABC-type Zn uptake system ZnuABC Zn-binding protein ZnuA